MLQDQSRNRTPMPAAQPAADVAPTEPRASRTEAGIARMLSAPPQGDQHSADPIFETIAESRRLHALWMGAYDAWPHDTVETPEALERMNGGCRTFMRHLNETVLSTKPVTVTGCAALGRYVVDLLDREEVDADQQGEFALRLITESLRALPPASSAVPPPPIVTSEQTTVLRAVSAHEEAWSTSGKLSAVHGSLGSLQGQQPVSAQEIEAGDNAASKACGRSDEAWRNLFKARPQCLHELWLLLTHIEEHHRNHHGMDDAPDVWGTLTGAVAAIRTATKAPDVPQHDLSKLSVWHLSRLYEICRQQRDILLEIEGAPVCERRDGSGYNALGGIVGAEGDRFAFLSDDVVAELERRRPAGTEERDVILETRVRHHLRCNGTIEPELVTEIAAAWGAK